MDGSGIYESVRYMLARCERHEELIAERAQQSVRYRDEKERMAAFLQDQSPSGKFLSKHLRAVS